MDFWLCFACPAKFCELLLSDLESSMSFVEDLINQVLKGLPLITLVVTTKLDFSLSENMYSVQLHILCCVNPEETPNDLRLMRLKIEAVISQALLQCFWEVLYAEC